MIFFKLIKRFVFLVFAASIVVLLLMSKCSPDQILNSVKKNVLPSQVSVSIPADDLPLANKVKNQVAAQYNVDASAVEITYFEFILWPNSCLGKEQGSGCDEVITPGYKVKVKVQNKEIEYHTDKSGQQIVKI